MLKDAPGLDQTGLDPGLTGAWHAAGPSMGADFAALMSQSPDIDDSETPAGFQGLDAELLQFSSHSLDSLPAETAAMSVPFSTALLNDDDHHGDTEDLDDEAYQDSRSLLSSQLTAVSQRAMRTARRLARSGNAPLMVSSPEVNEALEDTITWINIVKEITIGLDDANSWNLSAADCGLAFSALACHQNLIALFRAMCDAIHRRLQAGKEQRQQRQAQNYQHDTRDSGVGPFRVAQFAMVLQMLMHLISRMGRTLVSHNIDPSAGQESKNASATVDSIMVIDDGGIAHDRSRASSSATSGCSTPRGGLLAHVQEIGGNILGEHEMLRVAIQELQTEMDHPELH